ncbi:ABC transporter permease [Actinomycetota bacterium]
MIASVIDWLTDPAHWSGTDGIPARIVEHLWASLLVVALAAAIAIPLGVWVGHTGRGKWLVSAANALRAIPSLGLLFAVALWLGPRISNADLAFLLPAVIVLVILAIPPLLSGAYAGVEAVDPAARDAARGMGMSPMRVLREVELPCALPLILSGLRSATLQVVATWTIAAVLGVGGLGRYLLDGLASADYPQTAAGALLVAGLAVLVDLVLAGVERFAVSPGLTDPTRAGKKPRRDPVATTDPAGAPIGASAPTQGRDAP